ncbi:MAG: ABC transporter permease subunit [Chloroflexota bacterium]
MDDLTPGRSALRNLLYVVAGLATFLLYAYATDVTEINLEEPQDPQRQAVTTRVIRALARPDFFQYDEETRSTDITIRMPCPEEIKASQISFQGRVTTLTPNCASTTQETLTLVGEGFRPRTNGIVRWHPPGDVATTRALSSFRTDENGRFTAEFTLPDIRETADPQRIEVEEKWRLGIAGLSETSLITIEKIIETVFLALMATTVGTILAVPISFLAARNLMINVGSPLAAIMSAIIAIPIAAFVGSRLTQFLLDLAAQLGDQAVVQLIAAVAVLGLAWAVVRFGPSVFTDESQPRSAQITGLARLTASALLAFLGVGLLAHVGLEFGNWLEETLGGFAFIGRFLALVSESVLVLSPGINGLILALAGASLGSRYGQEAVLRLQGMSARLLTVVLSAVGTAVFVYGIGLMLNWLYQFDEPQFWTTYPAIAAAIIMAIVGFFVDPKRQFPIGAVLYTVTRSLLNIIRSIEPLIYVIVFAVWVGIGPFAGILALTGHTIAALGKLFSEQVENISEGPLEAVTATGANRLQTIVFAVIPQIVPPYIAFTLYRWDINVRFSTIIGFGGGGGIGFVLVQNINLLQYRQASVMMIAIAVVVMSLDYISSQIRSRII